MERYTIEEVARHNGRRDPRSWIVIRGHVYDVTDFMAQHPGGVELIAERAGTDATSAFEDLGHSSTAKKLLRKYEIGLLAELGKVGGTLASGSNDEPKDEDMEEKEATSTKKSNWRLRRRFLNAILGRCAST